jgi:hypothetical protein
MISAVLSQILITPGPVLAKVVKQEIRIICQHCTAGKFCHTGTLDISFSRSCLVADTDYPWADITVMVPGEADVECARVAKLTGCAVSTRQLISSSTSFRICSLFHRLRKSSKTADTMKGFSGRPLKSHDIDWNWLVGTCLCLRRPNVAM